MHSTSTNHTNEEGRITDFADDLAVGLGMLTDIVIGHAAGIVAHVLRRVDRLVDQVIEDAHAVAREGEELLATTLDRMGFDEFRD